jgi:flagellar biosynthesis protein FlhF
MKLVTFTGETPAVALRQVQDEFGDDALVVSTKEIRKKSLNTTALYEIVVAIEDGKLETTKDERAPLPLKTPSMDFPKQPLIPSLDGIKEAISDISQAAREMGKISKLEENFLQGSSSAKPNTPCPESEDVKKIKDELLKIGDKVKLIQNMVWEQNSSTTQIPMPAEFAEIYRVTKESGVAVDHLDAIMRETVELMPLAMRQNSQTVKRYFNVLLRKMLPIRHETTITAPNKKYSMLVGPTGVGKTTTLAKLAARYAFGPQKAKVGIITLDTYRIGAVEQLMHYAKMMRLPIEAVDDASQFPRILGALRHCDYILIDTAGSSPHDHEKIGKIKSFLKSQESTTIDVSLVVSATAKLDDLRDIYTNFNALDIDTLIVTKFDESRTFGNVLSLVHEVKKPLSYFSIGQEVPDDIMEADNDFFIRCMFDGFKAGSLQ